MKKLKLLYLPYAGGSAQICRSWSRYLDENIDVQPIELAGRGSRFKQKFYHDMGDALVDLSQIVNKYIDEPYALYGHSFGATLVFELYYSILNAGGPPPVSLFFSGSCPPGRRITASVINHLPDNEFINAVNRFNGMDYDILNNKELMDIFLPILRADFKVLEEYRYQKKTEKIKCPVSVLYGNDMTLEDVRGWGELSETEVGYHYINGNHFFVRKNTKEVLRIVNNQLTEMI